MKSAHEVSTAKNVQVYAVTRKGLVAGSIVTAYSSTKSTSLYVTLTIFDRGGAIPKGSSSTRCDGGGYCKLDAGMADILHALLPDTKHSESFPRCLEDLGYQTTQLL